MMLQIIGRTESLLYLGMEREIKFKIWLPEEKKLTKAHSIWELFHILKGFDEKLSDVEPDWKYVEYIGVDQKNKVGIFEGDIIRHNNNLYYVKFSKNQRVYVLRVINDKGMNWRSIEWLSKVVNYCEVVGNIYENPELL